MIVEAHEARAPFETYDVGQAEVSGLIVHEPPDGDQGHVGRAARCVHAGHVRWSALPAAVAGRYSIDVGYRSPYGDKSLGLLIEQAQAHEADKRAPLLDSTVECFTTSVVRSSRHYVNLESGPWSVTVSSRGGAVEIAWLRVSERPLVAPPRIDASRLVVYRDCPEPIVVTVRLFDRTFESVKVDGHAVDAGLYTVIDGEPAADGPDAIVTIPFEVFLAVCAEQRDRAPAHQLELVFDRNTSSAVTVAVRDCVPTRPVLTADDATLASGALEARDTALTGDAMIRIEESGVMTWRIRVTRTGRYRIWIRYRAAVKDQVETFTVNGAKRKLGFAWTHSRWLDTSVDAELVEGVNSIAIEKDWGFIDVHSLTVSTNALGEPAPSVESPSICPRRRTWYGEASAKRDLWFALDPAGHRVSGVSIGGAPVAFGMRLLHDNPRRDLLQIRGADVPVIPGEYPVCVQFGSGAELIGEVSVRSAAPSHSLVYVQFDVSHAVAGALFLPDGSVALIDCATRDGAESVVIPWLRAHGVQRIDHLVVTHYHGDHVGGLEPIRDAFEVGRFIDNRSVARGDTFDLGGTRATVLNAFGDGLPDEENSNSLSVRVEHRGFSLVHGADTVAENQERILREMPELVRADVYVANHHFHGSSSVGYLRATDPSIVLVSGEASVYDRGAYTDHYIGQTEAYLRARGARMIEGLFTYETGHIVVRANSGDDWSYETYRDNEPVPGLT